MQVCMGSAQTYPGSARACTVHVPCIAQVVHKHILVVHRHTSVPGS